MATQRLAFGEWMPDQPGITGSLIEARNVVPLTAGYGPLPSAVIISDAAAQPLLNAFVGRFSASTTLFAGGATRLFSYDPSDLSMNDVSKLVTGSPADYGTTESWDFTQFGNAIIAANGADKLQVWVSGSSTNFDDLATNAPTAKYVTVVRDFVVAANETSNPNRVYWSDINDETDWTPGVNSQSDTQDIPDGGNIQGVTGGEFGLIFLERAVVRMSYIGSPLFFQFDTISRRLGCFEPNSIVQYGNVAWFLADDGFYQCDGQSVSPIGVERIDKFFFNDLDQSRVEQMSAAVDPINKLVIWCYPNNGETNSLLVYNWQINRWSRGITSATSVASLASAGTSLEGLDVYGSLDDLGISLDSRQWIGGKLIFGGTQGDKLVTFSGATSDPEIRTGDIVLADQNSLMRLARPQIDNGSASVAVASRLRLDGTISYGPNVPASSENRVSLRSVGRYHRLRVIPSGDWRHAVGVDYDIEPVGVR
jgi:hypothetical protein